MGNLMLKQRQSNKIYVRSVNELGGNELDSYTIVMRAMPDLVGTSSKLIVLLMVQTSNIAAMAQNT